MTSSVRRAWVTSLALALVAGFWVLGALLYRIPVGLDASAFPAGEFLQGLFPGAEYAIAGAVWLVFAALVLAAIAFLRSSLATTPLSACHTGVIGVASGFARI